MHARIGRPGERAAWAAVAAGVLMSLVPVRSICADPEDPEPIPEGTIEIMAGKERRRVPDTIQTERNDAKRELGVLPIRGDVIGTVTPRFEINRKSVSGPSRARLRSRLAAMVELYRDAFGVPVDAALERKLAVLNAVEDEGPGAPPPIRTAYRHGAWPEPAEDLRRARERELVARALHESSHAIVAARFPDAPFWLDEGLAVALEGIEQEEDTLRARIREPRARRLERIRRSEAQLDPEEMRTISATEWENLAPEDAEDVRALLGSFVLLLLDEEPFRAAVAEILEGERDFDLVEEDPVAFDREWRDWLRSEMQVALLERPEPERPRKRIRRARGLRCVRGALTSPDGTLRPALFCSRRYVYSEAPPD